MTFGRRDRPRGASSNPGAPGEWVKARPSSSPTDIDHARQLVLERVRAPQAERISLADALGRVLAEDAYAMQPIPAFDNSAMDGFAVRAADTSAAGPNAPAMLRIVGESRAGAPASVAAAPGEALRISTGAMLPQGADAVVRLEEARVLDGELEVVAAVDPARDVRLAGEDVPQGARAISRGTVLEPAHLGVLASLGYASVACARRPRVAVLTTGDELQEPDEPYRSGGVRDTNAYTIPSLAVRSGAEVAMRTRVRDEQPSTLNAIDSALGNDVVIVCGGVSVGEHDHVRPALAELGVEEVFWRLPLRPGSPTWFGVGPSGELVFGLPGNPVSAMVGFLLLVRPALCAQQGAPLDTERARAIFDEPYAKQAGRAHAVRCRLELRDDGWHAHPTGAQGSHILTSMLGADALALIPAQSAGVSAGEMVEIELLR